MSRSKWKSPIPGTIKRSRDSKIFLKRSSVIMPQLVKKEVETYNGKNLIKIIIDESMIGHKIGEFVPTRARFVFKKKRKKK